MDAVAYFKAYARMCDSFDSKNNITGKPCVGCPLDDIGRGCHMNDLTNNAEECVAAVENWAKEHPARTQQSEFLAQWPNARLDTTGCLMICPMDVMGREYISKNIPGCINGALEIRCDKCRRDFWLAGIKDGET